MKSNLLIKLIFLQALLFSSVVLNAQVRRGSIDMTGDENRTIRMFDGSTYSGEGGSLSVEAWVYVKDDGSGSDFTFFTYTSGVTQIQISYNGDQNKGTSSAWFLEAKSLPEGTLGGTPSWSIDYKSGYSPPDFANSWHHVAVTCNSKSTLRIYIDGEETTGGYTAGLNGGSFELFFDGNTGSTATYMGGSSLKYGLKGKLYLGEIRLWDTQLSDSEVAKYYDEEVNAAHPEWNNLIRYYHGTESNISGSNRFFEDRSLNYEVDARGNNDDITISTSNTPPVKPPSFDDSDFSTSIAANTCQTSDIDVSWTNLRSSGTSNYTSYNNTTNHTYYMEVTRESDDKVIYDGTSTSTSDSDVEEGFKDRYILRTYWEIDGVPYYSDDSKTSGYGTIKEQYDAPGSFTVSTDNCDKSIDLSWSSSDGTPPQWKIEKSLSSGFSSIAGTGVVDGSITSYTSNNQAVETNIYYRVSATGTDDNGCDVSGENSSVGTGFTSYPPSTPTNGAITQDLANKTLNLTWSNPGGNNADSWIIKRSKFDGSNEVEFTTALGTTNYDDADLELCETYSYTLGAVNECATEGVFATTDLTGNISTDLSNAIATTEATKGYLSDAVQIEWSLNESLSSIDRFRLYRSRADKNNFSLIKVLDNDLIYTDETALGGVFYNYKVVGEAACNDNTIYTNEGIDMGFVIPYGVANGHVEYDGGNAVEGVTVSFEKTDGATGHSLELDGVDDYVAIENFYYRSTSEKEMTVEAWIKVQDDDNNIIASFDRNEYWRFELGGNTANPGCVGLGIMTDAGQLDFGGSIRVDDGEWHYVAATFDNGLTSIYVDGILDNSTTQGTLFGSGNTRYGFIGAGSEADTVNANITGGDYLFGGNIDEVRIWNVARSAEEIEQNYNRLLNGTEDGLAVYYRCDEGIGSNIYDASQTDDEYNKNDGLFVNEVAFSDDIPNSEQLGIKGITDEYGDYTVSYIPYSSGGEIFRVTPSFGQHTFEPNSRTVYVGDGAQTQNGLDFTDISSFTVTGKVLYKNTQVPVEGVSVLLDGAEVLGEDNQVVRTDANGDYEINVPIGKHHLSVYKDGHVFAEGYFPPLDAFGSITKHEFVEEVTVDFVDSTKVKVAGRIVGGEVEGNKTIGFDLSTNNIGVADLQFQLFKAGYDIDTTSESIYNTLSITTDPYSGEYEIELLPESWVVTKAGNESYFIDQGDLSVLDLSSSLTETTVTTTLEDSSVAEYTYHHLLNYIIREQPVITFTDQDYSAFDGDTVIVFTNQVTNTMDTLILGSESVLNYPVFQMGKNYTGIVGVKEYYNNPNHPDGPIADVVPVEGATVTIVDNMAILPGSVSGTTNTNGELNYSFIAGVPSLTENGDESYTKSLEIYANVDGVSIDWQENFRAYVLGSSPLEGTDFVSSGPDVPEIILRDPPGSNSYAYIEKGSTFSEATSYVMETSSMSAVDLNVMAGVTVEFGGGLAGPVVEAQLTNNTSAGISVMDYYSEEGVYSRDVTFTERIETSSDPDDVGSPADLYIGKSYNIYYTKSKNFKILPTDFCIENGLTYVGDPNAEYCLGMIDGFVINDDGASTYFIYSQRHILNELIPNLFELRNNLLLTSDYESHLTVASPYYGMNNDDPSLDDWKADTLAQNPSANVDNLVYKYIGTETDQVRFYNSQITLWLNAIAINEAEKASADVVRNISIDGTAGSFTSEIEEVYSTENNYFHNRDIFISYEQEFGATVNDNGASISVSGDLGYAVASGSSSGTENSLLFGYVIEDEDESDYYSIDVLKGDGVTVFADNDFSNNSANSGDYVDDLTGDNSDKSVLGALTNNITQSAIYGSNAIATGVGTAKTIGTQIYNMVDMSKNALDLEEKINENSTYDVSGFKISSPIFSVKGGQTKCPYHDEEYASFYVDEQGETPLLNTGTIRREIPIINVSPSVRNNVPDNQSATFTLQLQNGSDALGEFYEIMIDESTNPDGLELLIDGLTAERDYYIDPSSTVEKTLTVRKTKEDVMDYDSLAIIFRSGCQYDPTNAAADIADTVFISVHFLPSCASVDITSLDENWILNYENDNQANIKLEGYDLNLSTLEKIDFQYKSLSGSPITGMAWYIDTTSSAYQDYNGEKDILENSASSFVWDVAELTDREYQLRARAVCKDGSVTESAYITGIIDRTTPVMFGSPEPADGILNPEDDIRIRFNETLEAGLVYDHNISVTGVLNGADVSHSTSVQFNGSNQYARIPAISFNNKSFTIEYWLEREAGASGTVFSKGAGGDQLEIAYTNDEKLMVTLGAQEFEADPSVVYTSVSPVDAWHHWVVVYDNEADQLKIYADDQLLEVYSNIIFSPRNSEIAYIARDNSGSDYLVASVHEFRIWEKALSLAESVANMNQTLAGSEIGLYAYWPMDEGEGVLALDKASGRHLSLSAQWNLYPGSYAFEFDGASYLTLDGSNVVITEETDFTVEFWFNMGASAGEQTIFSSGKGDGSDTLGGSVEYAFSINQTASGGIDVQSNGVTFNAVTNNYADNQWHHFALVVDRQSTVRSYIDGTLQKSLSNANFAGLSGAELWLGVRGFREDPINTTFDQYFNGNIDEFRIWNSARSSDYLSLYKNTKLSGTETGLVAYLPFEEYSEVMGTVLRNKSFNDVARPAFSTAANAAVSNGNAAIFVDGASISDVRPVQDIPFEFVVNGDEIVITPLIDENRIEDQTLEISVSDVFDLNGNRQLSTASWTAYVQQNQLVWQESSVDVSHVPGDVTTFTATIANLGGVTYNYTLENMPAWLSSNASSGSVQANSTKTVTFTVNDGLNIGYYERSINLSTSLDFDEKLSINVSVTEPAPDWEVDASQYQYSMNIFGRLIIEDVTSSDVNDKVAAFVGDEVRGSAQVEYVERLDAYLLFLTIYSNSSSIENIELKAWDASEAKIHADVTPNVRFEANQIIGTSLNPQDIVASDVVVKSYALAKGWNWISFNLASENLAVVDSVLGPIGSEGDIVKGLESFDVYSESTGWLGTLTLNSDGFTTQDMYKVYVSEASSFDHKGTPVDPFTTDITLEAGWNYVGYTPQVNMTISEALAGLNSTTGDLVKSQSGFAMYDEFVGWIGSLKNMTPGTGYMFYSSELAAFTYPEFSSLSSAKTATFIDLPDLPEAWQVNPNAYENNMSVVAELELSAVDLIEEGEILVALSGEEVRGYATEQLVSDGKVLYFLTAFGSVDEELTFVFYNPNSEKVTELDNQLSYVANGVVGDYRAPYPLKLSGFVSESTLAQVTPNPFNDQFNIQTQCSEEGGTVQVFNTVGQMVYTGSLNEDTQTIEMKAFPSGSYLVVVNTSCGQFTEKLIKQ